MPTTNNTQIKQKEHSQPKQQTVANDKSKQTNTQTTQAANNKPIQIPQKANKFKTQT